MEELQNEELVTVVDVQFRPGQKIYFFDPAGLTLKAGDHVIMDTARGAEYGYCTGGNHRVTKREVVAPLRQVLRKATEQDERIAGENREKEERAFQVCQQKIGQLGLDMQLVSAECAFDGSKILFFFTADERVDFRELVKSLAGTFHTRIELRQIGVRDKAKMVGGLGICGRPFCCAEFLDDFQPVSIKMAKTQNLSLNPTKISGTCGRLMCCLKYEQDAYEDLIRNSPKQDSFVDTPEGRGTVTEVQLLRQRVKVQMEKNPETAMVFDNDAVAVLRSGKAKKGDAPIPDDLAPISGGHRRAAKRETEDVPILESIKFRYSSETIAEEKLAEPEKELTQPHRNRRRNRGKKPQESAPEKKPEKKGEKQPEKKPEKVPQKPQSADSSGKKPEEGKKNNHRRRSGFHRKKPKQSGE